MRPISIPPYDMETKRLLSSYIQSSVKGSSPSRPVLLLSPMPVLVPYSPAPVQYIKTRARARQKPGYGKALTGPFIRYLPTANPRIARVFPASSLERICLGSNLTFRVNASGAPSFHQWPNPLNVVRPNSVPLNDSWRPNCKSTLNPECKPFIPARKANDTSVRDEAETPELDSEDSISRSPTPPPGVCPLCRRTPDVEESESGCNVGQGDCPCCQASYPKADLLSSSSSSFSSSYLEDRMGKEDDSGNELNDSSDEDEADSHKDAKDVQCLDDSSYDSEDSSADFSWSMCDIQDDSKEYMDLFTFLFENLSVAEFHLLMREVGLQDAMIQSVCFVIDSKLEQMISVFAYWINMQEGLSHVDVLLKIQNALVTIGRKDLFDLLSTQPEKKLLAQTVESPCCTLRSR